MSALAQFLRFDLMHFEKQNNLRCWQKQIETIDDVDIVSTNATTIKQQIKENETIHLYIHSWRLVIEPYNQNFQLFVVCPKSAAIDSEKSNA